MKHRLLLLTLAALGSPALAQQPDFAASSRSVGIDVSVTVGQRPVEGLTIEDFRLLDSGQPRNIATITGENLPLDLAIVYPYTLQGFAILRDKNGNVPTRDATTDYFTRRMQNGAANVLRLMRPGDRVAFVSYGLDPHIDLPLTNDGDQVAAAIRRMIHHPGSPSPVTTTWLAVEYGVHLLAETTQRDPSALSERRRALVRMSGSYEGTELGIPYQAIARRLWEENIVFSSIAVMNQMEQEPFSQSPISPEFQLNAPWTYGGKGAMEEIARATGGDGLAYLDPDAPQDLLTRLRQRCTLWFDQPPNLPPGQERKITVDLSSEARKRFPNAVVQARQGYVTR